MSRGDWHLAQINISRLVAPAGDQCVQPSFDALDQINAMADPSPRIIRRHQDAAATAMAFRYAADPWSIGHA